jgi:short-subunit dehydrogenase
MYGTDLFESFKNQIIESLDSRNKLLFYTMIILVIIALLVLLKFVIFRLGPFVHQYFIMSENNLIERYSNKPEVSNKPTKQEVSNKPENNQNPWVLITGPTAGLGLCFTHEFAERGFNLLLIGSKRTPDVAREISQKYGIITKSVVVDFSKSFDDKFFDPIEEKIKEIGLNWSVLINNVGYRSGWINFQEMPPEEIKKTIAVGTMVQSRLTQFALINFEKRNKKGLYSSIVNITAQGHITTDFLAVEDEITLPYMSVYEATNAFGLYQAKSVYAEIKDKYPFIDFLIVTPGAVITDRTENVLKNTIFSVDCNIYVKNIMRMMGNLNGVHCAYWGHSISPLLVNIFPFVNRDNILHEVGQGLSINFENKYKNGLED